LCEHGASSDRSKETEVVLGTPADEHRNSRAKAEQTALVNLVQRLATQFPELPAEQIGRTVRAEYDAYATASIRDFIPVLVERSARSSLAEPRELRPRA
jgi:hypothetical protein